VFSLRAVAHPGKDLDVDPHFPSPTSRGTVTTHRDRGLGVAMSHSHYLPSLVTLVRGVVSSTGIISSPGHAVVA
jgi:hypothetical protein